MMVRNKEKNKNFVIHFSETCFFAFRTAQNNTAKGCICLSITNTDNIYHTHVD